MVQQQGQCKMMDGKWMDFASGEGLLPTGQPVYFFNSLILKVEHNSPNQIVFQKNTYMPIIKKAPPYCQSNWND